jgi:hypothetical protein
MSGTNGFREDELIHVRVKVGNEWQTRTFPVFGGRLRLAHGGNKNLSLQTEMVSWDGQYAVFKCVATTEKGQFIGFGSANTQRDSRLSESLIELAETRSCARALRFAGYGLGFTSAEEVSHLENETESPKGRKPDKDAQPIFPESDSSGKVEAKSPKRGTGNADAPKATQAQCRALFALTKRAGHTQEEIDQMLCPFNVTSFDELSREDASRLITDLQTHVAA